MAQKLSVTIALEGGKELERQLADIGKAGQQAFLDISKAAEQVGGFKNIKPEEVTQKLQQMGVTGVEALKKIQDAVASATRMERLVTGIQAVENAFSSVATAAASIGRALGPVGAIAVLVGTKIVTSMNEAAAATNKLTVAAAKAGLSIQEFDKIRAALEKGGIAPKGIEDAIQKISEAAEKGKIAQVAKDLENLQEISKRGFGPLGTPELQRLIDTAQGVGKASEDARKALDKLGVRIPDSAIQSLEQLAARTGSTAEGLRAFIAQLEAIKDPAERNKVAFQQMGEAGVKLAEGVQTGAISSKQSIDQLTQGITTLTQAQADAAARNEQAWNRMTSALQRFTTSGDFSQLSAALSAFTSGLMNDLNQIGEGFSTLMSKIGQLASSIGGDIWSGFTSGAQAAFDTVVGLANSLIEKLKQVAAWASSLFTGGGGGTPEGAPPGMASGGLIGGRGTGTSDSNLALLSRGEHIMPAAVVRQPGVLAFLEALRRSGGDLRHLLGGIGRFALGGPVGLPAGIGRLSGANLGTLTLGLPSGGSVTVRATTAVVDQLRHEAAMAQVRSGGRKPSRYT